MRESDRSRWQEACCVVADIMVYMRGRRAVVVFHLERVFVMVVVSDAFLVYQRVPERQRLLADAHGCER